MSEFHAGDGAGDAASVTVQAQEKVQQTAQQATQKTAELLRRQTEERASQASRELRTVAGALRRSGHALHADGNESSGAAIDTVTQTIERLSGYLAETDGDRMLHDVESFGRRRPWAMIGIGLGLGVAASRLLKASSQTRYRATQTPPSRPPAALAPPPAVEEPVTRVGYVAQPGVYP